MKLALNRLLICAVIVWSATIKLHAQSQANNDSVRQLHEAIVTYQANVFTPVTFQNITRDEIKTKSTGQEPSFLLIETPSITNYSDAGSTQGYSYFRLRGIDQTRINVTLDGVPLNEPEDQGAYFSNYPDLFNSVSRVQIQRGVGTSKNGVASYAGSLQLFSPNLNDSAKMTMGFGYGSYNSLRGFAEFNSGLIKHMAFYARASEIYSSGYKYGASNHSQSIFFSTGLFYNKSVWRFNVVAGHQQNGLAWLGVSDSLINIDRRTNADKNEHDRFVQCLGQAENYWTINSHSSLQSCVYYIFLTGNYDFNPNSFLGLPSTNELLNYAFLSNLEGAFANYSYSKNHFNLTAGLHANIYDRNHIGSDNLTGELYNNTGYKDEVSLFTKADYTFKWVTFFADLQYRYTTFLYKGSVQMPRMNWNFFNPKAGLIVSPFSNCSIYYSIGRSGHEPTRNDMFGGSDDLLADSLGHALLSITTPEYVLDHELGIRYQSTKCFAALNLYYMDFKNEIVLNGQFGPNGLALTDRVTRSFRSGIELSVNYKPWRGLAIINNSSFNYSRINEQHVTFSPILTPPVIINQEIQYSIKGFLFSVSGRYQYASFINFANTASVKSYFLLNAQAGYFIKGFSIDVFVNNITNAKYFNNGYVDTDGSNKYFVQMPVNFYISLKYTINGLLRNR